MFDKQHEERSEFAMIPPEVRALERRLAAQALAPVRIDRDRLMFEAGRAAAGGGATVATQERAKARLPHERHWSRSRFWPAMTATMTAATVALAIALAWPNRPVKVVEAPRAALERVDASEIAVAAETGESPRAIMEGAIAEDGVVDWEVDRRLGRDPWGLSHSGTRGLLTARGLVAARDGASLADELPEYREVPEKSLNVRDLMNELLPERLAERGTRT